jgi:hypothetical protein
MIILFLFFSGCDQKTTHELKVTKKDPIVPVQVIGEIRAQLNLIENAIPRFCTKAWSMHTDEVNKLSSQFHTDYIASVNFITQLVKASEKPRKIDPNIRLLVGRLQEQLSMIRKQLDLWNIEVAFRFLSILTSCHCLRLAASISWSDNGLFWIKRATILLREATTLTDETRILKLGSTSYVRWDFKAVSASHVVSTYEDIQLLQTMIFFAACRTRWCIDTSNMIATIVNHPERLPAGMPLINSFLFGDLPDTGTSVVEFWNKNVVPKIEQIADT